MKFVSNPIQSPDERSQWIDPKGEFLQAIQQRLTELSQHIQNLQNSSQTETFGREWLALHLHLLIIKTLITERLEQLNESTTHETHS